MGIFTFIILLLLFSFLIVKDVFKTSLSSKTLLIGWAIKLGFASLFIFIYTYYYTNGELYGDVRNFMLDSKVLSDVAKNNPAEFFKIFFGYSSNDLAVHQTLLADTNIWSYGDNGDFINDNRLIIRINAIIHLFSCGNLWVHALCFAFISFIGILLIYKTFKKLTERPEILFFGMLLFPTISFWGSGINKEALLLFSLGLFLFSLVKLISVQKKGWFIFLMVTSIFLLLFNKPHVGLFIFPFLPVIFLIKRFGFTKKVVLSLTGIIFLGVTILCFTPSKVNLVHRISFKQKDLQNQGTGGVFFVNDSAFCSFDYVYNDHFEYQKSTHTVQVIEEAKGEYKLFGTSEFIPFKIAKSTEQYDVYHIIAPSKSMVNVPYINYSPLQLLKNTPLAMINVLVRPFPTDGGSSLKHVLFVENLLFLICLAWAIAKRRSLNINIAPWFYFLIFSATGLVLLIGWTTPILGAIARYKMAPLLLLLIAICLILPSKKPRTTNEVPD